MGLKEGLERLQEVLGGELQPQEARELLKVSGQTIKRGREILLSNSTYRTLPAEERARLVNQLEDQARKEAKQKLFIRVLKRLPAGRERAQFIEYGVRNLGFSK